MDWFLIALSCMIMWSITDILFKVALDRNDPLSHHKAFVWIGIIMALAGGIMCTWSDTLLDSIHILMEDVLYLIPLCLFYAAALYFGLLGVKHLDASVISPLENIDGAMTSMIIYFYFLVTGYIHPSYTFGIVNVIGTVSILIGIILLGSQEQALLKQELHISDDKKKHRYGALALFFPLLYNLADVFTVSEISGMASGETEASISAIDFFIFECAGFALVAIGMWFYLLYVKKCKYNPFMPEEMVLCGAATGETFGTMLFLLAAEKNPLLTGPLTSLYCLFTIVLARIFLKERLTKKQYISLAFMVGGIAFLGIAEIFGI